MRVVVGPIFFYSHVPGCISILCVFDHCPTGPVTGSASDSGHLSDELDFAIPLPFPPACGVPHVWRDIRVRRPGMLHRAVFPCGAHAQARLATPSVALFVSCNFMPSPLSLADHAAARVKSELEAGASVLVFHLGDQVYCDDVCVEAEKTPENAEKLYRDEWIRTWSQPRTAALLQNGVHMMVPDDHEVCDMARFCPGRTDVPAPSVVAAALKVANEFMPTASFTPQQRCVRIMGATVLVQTHRTFAQLDLAPSMSFLGTDQELMLETAAGMAETLIVAAPTPPVFFSPSIVKQSLDNFQSEIVFNWTAPPFVDNLAKTLAALTEKRPEGARTAIVAGEMHTMTQTRITNTATGKSIIQFVASGISNVARTGSFFAQKLLMNSDRSIADGKFVYDHLLIEPVRNYLVFMAAYGMFEHIGMTAAKDIFTKNCTL